MAGRGHEPGEDLPAAVPVRGWLNESQQTAWRSFQVMQARLNGAVGHDLAQHSELSAQDYVVLVALTDQAEGELRVFQLGEMLGWEKSRVSHQVKRMAERGLVDKKRCGADRRGATVRVTPTGWEAIRAAAPSHVDAVRRWFVDVLTDDELTALGEACRRVVAAIDSELGNVCPQERGTPKTGLRTTAG
ncbi:MAG TPA: MarR family winged helix-turn-helix transcriptional regulator [Acidimicrobiales bacterium]|nr:MarR family winged helix-turn-helix transcriptional regulator [Acidimicrobiales bacterium]